MPLLRERRSRRAWRRRVADDLVERLDREGELRLVGSRSEDRREMLKVAVLMPDDVIAELYEDPYYPGYTFMELRHVSGWAGEEPPVRVIYPEEQRGEAV
jgi:hypothetical protein